MAETRTHTRRTLRPIARGVLSSVAAFAVALSGVALTGVAAANALDPATVSVTKVTNNSTPSPGEVFAYTLNYTCSSPTTDCANAKIVDTIPAEFEIVGGTANPVLPSDATATIVGQTITVVFTDDIDGDDPGLSGATGGSVGITVQMRSDIPPTRNGEIVTNTATITADNSPTDTGSVPVTLDIPPVTAVSGSKSFSPTSAVYGPGTTTTITLNAKNDSNLTATSIVITDPADPSAGPGAFDALNFVSFGSCALPSGATSVRVDAYDAAGTLHTGVAGSSPALPAGLAAADVTGLVFTYAGNIAVGATVTCNVVAEQRTTTRTAGTALVAGTTVSNTATVNLNTSVAAATPVTTNTATYQINPLGVAVTGSKSFAPSTVIVPTDNSTTVTLGARNTSGTTLDTLTISEPSPGFIDGVNFTFDSWVDSQATWPSGATSASVQWFTTGGTVSGGTVVAGDALPAPPANVRGFTITYSGAIANSATASLPFAVTVAGNTVAAGDSATFPNTATVDGHNAAGDAPQQSPSATLTVQSPVVATVPGKTFNPSQLISQPGRRTVATLTANTSGSTVPASQITIQDPPLGADGTTSAEFYRFFDARSVTLDPIPADVNAQIYVSIGDPNVAANWRLIDSVHGQTISAYTSIFANSTSLTAAERDLIQGVRIVETKDAGATFPNPTTVQAAVSYAIRSTPRTGTTPGVGTYQLENCVTTTATSAGATSPLSDPACKPFTLVIAPAAGDGIAKWWDDPDLVHTRSHEQASTILGWRVANAGATSAVVSDPYDETAPVASTVYEAFDLVAIKPITASGAAGATFDEFIKYDTVSKVELYENGAWTDITSSACPTAADCEGKFSGYTLTTAERAATTGVRLTFAEFAAARTNNTFPALGAGVAYGWPAACDPNTVQQGSTEECTRSVGLTFQVRDTRRSNGSPVLGSQFYNYVVGGSNVTGAVDNTTKLFIDYAAAPDATLGGSDHIALQDPTAGTTGTKAWSPSTVTLPGLTDPYPTSNLTLTGAATGLAYVDSLSIADPTAATNPFDVVNITSISGIVIPTGATDSVVTLTRASGTTNYTSLAAMALTPADLADVTGVAITFTGRIAPSSNASITLGTQVRTTHRDGSTFDPPSAGFVDDNTATVTTVDAGISPAGNTAQASQALTIMPSVSGTTATKTFSPATTNVQAPSAVSVVLDAGLTGSVNKKTVVLTDESPTFYNAFDLSSIALTTTPAGADNILFECRVDTYSGSPITVTPGAGSTGGWYSGTVTALPLASDFSAMYPTQCANLATVTGIRITFTGTAITGTHAVITLNTALRSTLRTGGVLSTTVGSAPNPDETVLGAVTDTLLVDAVDTQNMPTVQTSSSPVFIVNAGTASVQISKTSSDKVYPSIAIPYKLKFYNDGTAALTSPVVVDQLPANLVYDPTTMAPSYSSSLGVSGMGDGTVVYDASAGTLTYTWPAGVSLAVGETLTITQPLRVAPGTISGTTVINNMGITSDRVITSCTKDATTTIAATYDAANNACNTFAAVLVQTDGGYVITKDVKGAAGSATNVVNPATACIAASGGYYRYPCAADSLIGGTDNWRINLINAGNLPGSQLQVIDVLPHPGDSQVLNTSTARGSTTRPQFAGNVVLNIGNVPASGIETLTYYSTSDTPCTDDLSLSATPCPAAAWTLYDPAVTDPAIVKSLKFVFNFANTTTPGDLPPAAVFSVSYDTINVPESSTNPEGVAVGQDTTGTEQAWNSVAIGASFRDGASMLVRDPLDSRKAGIDFPEGSIGVTKVVDGTGAALAPTSFDATVTCTYGTAPDEVIPVAMTNGGAVTLDNANGYTVQLDAIPLGVVCTTVEAGSTGSYGEATRTVSASVSPTVTATDDTVDAASVLTLTNTYVLPIPVIPALLGVLGHTGVNALAIVLIGGLVLALGLALIVIARVRSRRARNL